MALYAMRDDEIRALIRGVACLSTPFLHVRRRNLGPSGIKPLAIVAIVGLFSLLDKIASVIFPNLEGYLLSLVEFLILAVAAVGVALAVRSWARRVLPAELISGPGDWLERLEATFAFPNLAEEELLILRASGDEAAGMLASSQFASWIINRVYRLLGHGHVWTKELSEVGERLRARPERRFFTKVAWVLSLVILVLLMLSLAMDFVPVVDTVGFVIVVALLVVFGIIYFFSDALGCVSFYGEILVGLCLVPFAILMPLVLLPFGPEALVFGLLLEITVEPAPPGRWVVHQMPNLKNDVPLWHSATYTAPNAISIICDWLSARKASTELSVGLCRINTKSAQRIGAGEDNLATNDFADDRPVTAGPRTPAGSHLGENR